MKAKGSMGLRWGDEGTFFVARTPGSTARFRVRSGSGGRVFAVGAPRRFPAIPAGWKLKAMSADNRLIDVDLVALWNSGIKVTTQGIFYVQSGLVEAERPQVEGAGCEHVEREYIVLPNGLSYPVCPACKQFILADIVEETREGLRKLRHNICLWAECRFQLPA